MTRYDRPATTRKGVRRLTSVFAASVLAVPLTVGALAAPLAEATPKTPDVAKLAGGLASQDIVWETCDFGSPALNQRLNVPNVACATVKVPKDWTNPTNGETWDIRISQAKNREVTDADYLGTIFANPGGPGGSGLPWGPVMQERTPDLVPYYNYVGFDPRGVGQSSQAACYPVLTDSSGNDLTDEVAIAKAIGDACATHPDVRTISTEQTAYDMDFIRHLLQAPKLSYIGYSYGTWLGAWYSKIFGPHADKMVLDSAIDGTAKTLQSTWDDLQPKARDRQFELRLMNYIARHDATYGLGESASSIYDRYLAASEELGADTMTLLWLLTGAYQAFPNNDRYPEAAEFVALVIGDEPTSSAARMSVSAALTATDPLERAQELLEIREDASFTEETEAKLAPLQELSEQPSVQRRSAAQGVRYNSPFDFIRCNDGQWTQGGKYWTKANSRGTEKYPVTAQLGIFSEVPPCAFWPTRTTMPKAHAKTYPTTVVVQPELDSQTGWAGGYASGTKLPNTSFVAIDNEGSHGAFPYGTQCVDRPILDFFLEGTQPTDIRICQALPLLQVSSSGALVPEAHTYENWGKLNSKARHVKAPSGPFDIATEAPGPRTTAIDAGRDELTQVESDPLVRSQIFRLYGAEGVEVMEREGVLLPTS